MSFPYFRFAELATLTAVTVGVALAATEARATDRFVVSSDGKTVADLTAKLTWQREQPTTGGTWNTGEFTSAAAAKYCSSNAPGLPGSGWRLPTVRELLSIVNRRVSPTVFPAFSCCLPSQQFWTSTPRKQNAATIWFVNFYSGFATYSDGPINSMAVRCVRSS
jgi:hypothetical protein